MSGGCLQQERAWWRPGGRCRVLWVRLMSQGMTEVFAGRVREV